MTTTPNPPVTNKRTNERINNAVLGGLVAGIIGGIVLAIVLLLENKSHGADFWVTFKFASLPFFHERATQPGFDAAPFFVGLLDHFAISAAWGIVFGLACYGLNRGVTVAAGLVLGVVAWLVMFYVVLPLVGVAAAVRNQPVWLAIFNHLIFGLAVGVAFLPYQRALRRPILRPAHTT